MSAYEIRFRAEMARLNESLTVISARASLYAEHVAASTAGPLWTGEAPSCLAQEATAAPGR